MYIMRNGHCFWGSNCRCYEIPILNTEDEFWNIDNNKPSVNEVQDVPQAMSEWVTNNAQRIQLATIRGTLPYWIRDNNETIATLLNPKPQKPTALEIAKQRHANRTERQVQYIKDAWEQRKFDNLDKKTEAIRMYQDLKTAKINGELNDDVDLSTIYDDIKSGYFNRALSRLKIWTSSVKRHSLRTQSQIDSIKQAWDSRPATLLKSYTTNAQVEDTFKRINSSLMGDKWFVQGDLKLWIERAQGNNGSTDMSGNIWLKQNRLDNVKSALSKIGSGKSANITEEEADAMATFWHEITHNRHNNSLTSGYAGSGGSKTRKYMELANEYVARNTLQEFYNKLGVNNIPYPEFMNNRESTGYNQMVNNYDFVVNTLKLDKGKVLGTVKNHLFTQDYIDQLSGLIKGLKAGGIKKLNGRALSNAEMNKLLSTCMAGTSLDVTEWLTDHNVIL